MRKFFSLEKQISIGVLFISLILTAILSSISFYLEYKKEISTINQAVEQIEKSIVPSLIESVWDFDEVKINLVLDSIEKIPNILHAGIIDKEKSSFHKDDICNQKYRLEKNEFYFSIPLIKNFNNEQKNIGNLEIYASDEPIIFNIKKRAHSFFLLEFLKSLIVIILILIFLRKFITHRLLSIYSKIKDGDLFYIDENKSHFFNDEISTLINLLNIKSDKIKSLTESNNELIKNQSEEIQLRKMEAIEASRLTSLAEMSSGIAHEINNPLAVMKGTISILEKTLKTEIESNQNLANQFLRLNNMIERIIKIIKSMRLSSRDCSEDPFEKINFSSMLDDIISLSSIRLKNSDIHLINNNIVGKSISIRCRSGQIFQVMINLINNSADAISFLNEKWIKIDSFTENKFLYIKITDSGNGIPPHVLQKLFQPFYTTKEVGKGTGLGLSISRKIINEHQGTLYYNPKSENTQFIIELPLEN